MSARAPLPLGYHPNWLAHADAFVRILEYVDGSVELAILQLNRWLTSDLGATGDADQSSRDRAVIEPPVWSKLVEIGDQGHEEEKLLSRDDWANDDIVVTLSVERSDDGRLKLSRKWRDEIVIGLRGKPENPLRWLFLWQPVLEEFLGLRPAAKKAKKVKRPPPARGETKKQAKKERPPTLRRLMIVHILCNKFSDDFSDDDIAGKTGVVRDHWEAECKAPLRDASRRVTYALPDRKTVRTTIRDYLARSETYLKYLKPR